MKITRTIKGVRGLTEVEETHEYEIVVGGGVTFYPTGSFFEQIGTVLEIQTFQVLVKTITEEVWVPVDRITQATDANGHSTQSAQLQHDMNKNAASLEAVQKARDNGTLTVINTELEV